MTTRDWETHLPPPPPPSPPLGAHLPLDDPLALTALASIPGISPPVIASLVKAFPTYAALAAASPDERAARARNTAAGRLPADLPPVAPLNLPPGLSVLVPGSDVFPGCLLPYPELAPVLFSQGVLLSSRTALAVLGDSNPTPTARAAGRVAVRSAAFHGLPVVVVLNSRFGSEAAAYAVEVGATVWGVLSSGHSLAPNLHLVSEIVSAGGSVVSTFHWLQPSSLASRSFAERLAVVLSSAVLCASAPVPGLPSDSAAPLFAEEYARPRIVPRPEDPVSTRVSDLGLKLSSDTRFARSRHWQADVVVSDPAELEFAVSSLASSGHLSALPSRVVSSPVVAPQPRR